MGAHTLVELFRRGRPSSPGAVLLDVPGGPAMTYGEADVGSARLAGSLAALGVRPGDRVAVQVEKSPFSLLVYLACVRSGAVLVPMNPAYTDDEVRYLLADAAPTVFVRDPSDLAADPVAVDDVEPRPDDLAAILYTSGTTGRPKGAALTHRNLATNAATLVAAWGFRSDDVLLHALPLHHAHGLFVAANCALASGASMVFLPRFDVDAVLEQLPRSTVFMGVPTYYTRLLADPRLDRDRCAGVRLFVSGSAPLSAATHEAWQARTGHAVLERYGMTETIMLTSNPLDGERRPGSVGPPLPGVDVRVLDGAVEVRGPNVFGGYWRRPELSATEFTADGWFRTGDLGRFDDDGYLHLVGRAKDLVISGGLNVYPKEVEDVLDALDGVEESAVVGVPDADLGEVVVAAVVPRPGAAIDPERLRSDARARLAGYKVPKRIHVVEALPRNTMGKVEKTRLRADLGGQSST